MAGRRTFRILTYSQLSGITVKATLPPACADCLEIWEPQPPGTLRALLRIVMGLLYLYLLFIVRVLPFPRSRCSCVVAVR